MKKIILLATTVACSVPAASQDMSQRPLQVASANSEQAARLPANTEILLRMNQEVTTKGKRWNEGDTFNMSVVHDVMYGDYVVIPRGSRGVGRITWLTDKGAFGKSGKMDIELEYIEVAGRRIDINGTYRQEGEGNTVATVGGVLVAGVFAAFITGKSGRIPQGRELMATTESDIVLALPATAAPAPTTTAQVPVQSSAPVSAMPVTSTNANQPAAMRPEIEPASSSRLKKSSPLRCETC